MTDEIGDRLRGIGGRAAVPADRRRALQVLQLLGALVLIGAALTAVLSGKAAAAGTGVGASGNIVPGAAAPIAPFTANMPFSSGQGIDVSIPANSVFTPGALIFILECAAPNGVLPTSDATCDGNTVEGPSITAGSDGSFDFVNEAGFGYPIYSLPNSALSESPTGQPVCGVGVANECVLYIGENQGDFTQPHFFSQVFQVSANAGNTGANPGDGNPAPATGVSSSLSTVTPATQTVTADGSDAGTVTVTLLDSGSNPVSGKTVALTPSGGHSTINPASSGSNVTNGSGQASFTVTDATAETVTYSAADSTDSVSVTQTAQVTFAAQVVSATSSSVTANPTQVAGGGSSTVTVTLRDSSVNGTPQPVAGKTVTLTPSGGSSVINPASTGSDVTDTNGQATFTVTDTTNEVVTYTAVDTTDNVTISTTASVTFGTVTLSASASTVVAAPTTADTGATGGSLVTVTLLAADGTSPISGQTVTLTAPSSTATETPATAGSDVTDANGKATFTVTDTAVEPVTFTASVGSVTITQTATVTFETPTGPTASASESTVTGPALTVPADGSSQGIIVVTVLDTSGQAMAGQTVTLAATPSTTVTITPVLSAGVTPGTTNASGQVQFSALDEHAETVTFTATVGSTVVTQTAAVTFTAGQGDSLQSTVAASPDQVPADGTTASTVTVTVLDHFGNPVAGNTVTLAALSGGNSVISPAATAGAMSGANGVATFTVTDATAEVVTYQATDTDDNVIISQTASVTFGSPPPPLPVVADCAVTSSAPSVAADGSSSATITVELRDTNGFPVADKSVTLTASGGSSTITGVATPAANVTAAGVHPLAAVTPTSTTDSNGNADFTVSDTAVESVTYSATDTTDNLPLTGMDVTVSFTAASAATTTTTAAGATTTTTSAGSGSSTSGTTGSSDSGSASLTGTGTGTSGSSLAFTGASPALPWLFGLGLILLLAGTLGRRLLLPKPQQQ